MAQTIYSSAYKAMTLGSTTRYEPIPLPMERSGLVYTGWFTVNVPVGVTTGDIIKLLPYQTLTQTASPQIQGIRHARVVLTNSGDWGGTCAANFGFVTGSATAFGAALTTPQSATTLDVAIATLQATAPLLANDDLQLVLTTGTSTTLRTVTGFVQAYFQAP